MPLQTPEAELGDQRSVPMAKASRWWWTTTSTSSKNAPALFHMTPPAGHWGVNSFAGLVFVSFLCFFGRLVVVVFVVFAVFWGYFGSLKWKG